MTAVQAFVADLAATIAAGYVQRDTRYEDAGRRRYAERSDPRDVARYSIQIAEEIVGLARLGPDDIEALQKRREMRDAFAGPVRR